MIPQDEMIGVARRLTEMTQQERAKWREDNLGQGRTVHTFESGNVEFRFTVLEPAAGDDEFELEVADDGRVVGRLHTYFEGTEPHTEALRQLDEAINRQLGDWHQSLERVNAALGL